MPPKAKRDFRLKTETVAESQSCLGWQDYGSQQVAHSVRCPTIPCIWYLSPLPAPCQPCGVSLMTRPQGPQYQMQTQTTQPLPRYSQYTVRLMTQSGALWPLQIKLCDLLSATTEFTNCSPPKPKVRQMWYDCFRPKPNVRRKCPIYSHSAPKPKSKPKFGWPLIMIEWRDRPI